MSDVAEKVGNLTVNEEPNGASAAPPAKPDYREEARKEVAGKIADGGWLENFGKGGPGKIDKGWAASAERYEWKEEYGDVAPELPILEAQLFKGEHIARPGARFDGLDISVVVESEEKVAPIIDFDSAGLHPVMRRNVELCGYDRPTPIQCYTLPAILTNHDMIAVAQTGSGKTAAFLIPILSKLMGKAKKLCGPRPGLLADFNHKTNGVTAEPLVLIVVPTRELAIQIFDEARRLCYRSMLRPCVAYGGAPKRGQMEELRRGCDILIGSPGRLWDFLSTGDLIKMNRLKYTVIDEADELVSQDWVEDMEKILDQGDSNEDADHRYMLFSATFPAEARRLARQYLSNKHIRVRVGRIGSTHRNIKQSVIEATPDAKENALKDLILSLPATRTLIFVNRKESADLVDDYLHHLGFPSTSIHSDRPQKMREDALQAFKTGITPILVATAVSARGIDVPHIMHVINYDLPPSRAGVPEAIAEYVHRIGRTARIGNEGFATSFFDPGRDEALGPMLAKILTETAQEIPSFLSHFTPEGDIDWEDDSEDEMPAEADGGAGGGGDGWDNGGDAGGNGGDAGGNVGSDDAANGGNWGSGGDASASATTQDAPAASNEEW